MRWPCACLYTILRSQWELCCQEQCREHCLLILMAPWGELDGDGLSSSMVCTLSELVYGKFGVTTWLYLSVSQADSHCSTCIDRYTGVCTIFVALLAFFCLPGYPERQNPLSKWYLKPRHIEIALKRSRRVGRKPQVGITIKRFFRSFSFWHLWAFAIAWAIGGNTTPTGYFNLWLKSLKNADGTLK